MIAAEFCEKLRRLAPTVNELSSQGVAHDEIEKIRSSYFFIKRESVKSNVRQQDEVLRLVQDFDGSAVEIGMVRFHSAIEDRDDGWIFGQCEADPLFLCRVSGEVKLKILGRRDPTPCAVNGAKFLDAMIVVAESLEEFSHLETEMPNLRSARADSCANLAGGSRFSRYFVSLLG